jgi:hypothetical protein
MISRRELLQAAGALLLPGLPLAGVQVSGLERILNRANHGNWTKLPIGDLVARVGRQFIGTPYVASTLEKNLDHESCIVTLDGFDCVTFFETSLGIARMIRSSSNDLVVQVTLTRYRGGKLDGYPSRLHYTADWIRDNARKGVVQDLTPHLPGAQVFRHDIHFMSAKPQLYGQLKVHPDLIPAIAVAEKALNTATLHYVPKEGVAHIEPKLQNGDIIGITTSIDGIDCSHTGLIAIERGEARFLHASSTHKQVTLGPPLHEYLAGNSKSTGIMVARPL